MNNISARIIKIIKVISEYFKLDGIMLEDFGRIHVQYIYMT